MGHFWHNLSIDKMIRVLAVLCLAALAMGQDAKAGGEEHHGDHGDHHGHHGEASELVSRTGRVSDAEADAGADADAKPNPYYPYYGLLGYGGYGYVGYPYGYFGKRSTDVWLTLELKLITTATTQ